MIGKPRISGFYVGRDPSLFAAAIHRNLFGESVSNVIPDTAAVDERVVDHEH